MQMVSYSAITAALGGLLALSACGGGGPTASLDDPRVAAARAIVASANTMIVPAGYTTLTEANANGGTDEYRLYASGDCTGLQCTLRGSVG